MTHPYFTTKAREVFTALGGYPANATALATWTEAARDRHDIHGVIVAADGTLIAETVRNRGNRVRASYVSKVLVPGAEHLAGLEVALAAGRATRDRGPRCAHITRASVCMAGMPGTATQPQSLPGG